MKRIIGNIVITIYALIAVFTTVCLLSYNQYKVSEFGDYSFILVTNEELVPNYNKGDLVIAKSRNKSKIEIGDNIFFYTTQEKQVDIALAEVTGKEIVSPTEITFTIGEDHKISSKNVIGISNDAKAISKVGGILSVLESKWGFLFLIVFPSLLAFLYEITVVFSEIKNAKKEGK